MLRTLVTWVGVQIAFVVVHGVVTWLMTRRRPSLVLVACVINALILYCTFAIVDEFRDHGLTGWGVVRAGFLGYITLRALMLGWVSLLAMRAGDAASRSARRAAGTS